MEPITSFCRVSWVFVFCVSTIGVSPVTLTVSCRPPTRRSALSTRHCRHEHEKNVHHDELSHCSHNTPLEEMRITFHFLKLQIEPKPEKPAEQYRGRPFISRARRRAIDHALNLVVIARVQRIEQIDSGLESYPLECQSLAHAEIDLIEPRRQLCARRNQRHVQ